MIYYILKVKKGDKIMAIIDDIIDSVGKAGKFVAEKSVDAKDYVKLEYKLANIKSDINKSFLELGRLCYNGADEAQKAQLIGKLDALKVKQNELLKEMEKFKKTCSSCGKRAGANDTFCKSCGNKL